MNRTIKFEYGFQSQNGIVKKVYDLGQIPQIAQLCDVWNELPICYVRQFAGILDKDGKEIYEGDVVSDGFKNLAIKFMGGSFGTWDGESFTTYSTSWRVIGNIHDIPELLEEKQ